MAQLALDDYPDRYALTNELHARPFPELTAPCRALHLAIKPEGDAAGRDRERDRAHLAALLDRYGAPHPPPGANHYSGHARPRLPEVGDAHRVRHLHAVPRRRGDAAVLGRDVGAVPRRLAGGDARARSSPPASSASSAPSATRSSALIAEDFPQWFVLESLAVAQVVDAEAVIAGDFRIDEHGHGRFVVLAVPGIGQRRLGRIVQRVLEIETYRAMALLTLPVARQVAATVARLDRELAEVVASMAAETGAGARDPRPAAEDRRRDRAPRLDQRLPLRRRRRLRGDRQPAHPGAARGADRRAAALRRVHDAPLRAGDAHLPLGRGAAVGPVGPGRARRRPAPDPRRRGEPGAERRGAAGDGPARGDAAPAAGDRRGAVGGRDQLLRRQPRRRGAGAARRAGAASTRPTSPRS